MNKRIWTARHGLPVLAGVVFLVTLVLTLPLLRAHAAAGGWTSQFGTRAHNAATSLAVDASGNAYVAGWTSGAFSGYVFSGGARDAFVRKYDTNGTESWTRQFGTRGADA